MKAQNIYLCGVGGQGIGLLAEVLIRSCMRAGYEVKGVDTHGLAQRGGTVESHLRIGRKVFAPLVPPGAADLVVGLERLEAYRAAGRMLKRGGTVVYYDSVYQPIHVRIGMAAYPGVEDLDRLVKQKDGMVHRLLAEDLPDPRMQNAVLLGKVASLNLVEGLLPEMIEETMKDVIPPKAFQENLDVFRKAVRGV